jgi:hypothetical protein
VRRTKAPAIAGASFLSECFFLIEPAFKYFGDGGHPALIFLKQQTSFYNYTGLLFTSLVDETLSLLPGSVALAKP